jgi:signal transduction histidine kinase/CheY-like chemotaxis protein
MSLQPGADSALMTAAVVQWLQDVTDRGIFTTDTTLIVRGWNRWLEIHTGRSAADVIGLPLAAVCPDFEQRGIAQYYAGALSGESRLLSERFHRYLFPIAKNAKVDGLSEMAQSARITPLSHGEMVIGTVTVIEDVTERVVKERELRSQIATAEQARRVAEEASRLKDEFLATMSHEIRTPLNAVLGWARMLRTQPELRSRTHALEVIERNAAAQLRLVEDMLDVARVVSGKLRLEVTDVDLAAIAAAAVEVVQPSADARRIAIRMDVEPGLPLVSGDADRLQQVVWNLLSNAVKFTESGGTVDVALTREQDRVVLRVVDTGQGIVPEFLPFVFDRFRQADGSASRRHGGLGLGLALVRYIVELHGGYVRAHSPGPQRGSTFIVELPVGSVQPIAPFNVPAVPVMLDGISVLIVDDNDDGREMLAANLAYYGADVRDVASAAEALRIVAEPRLRPDVVVSDLGMPETDGYELVRRIRAIPGASNLPAIAVTAYANDDDRTRALVAGYHTHLSKPVDGAVLAAAIAAVASRTPRSNS